MYIVPLLGDVPLDDLSGQDVQKFLNKLAKLSAEERFTDKHKNLSRKKSRANQLTPASVKLVHATLKSVMTRAVKWGRLAINPSALQQKVASRPKLADGTTPPMSSLRWEASRLNSKHLTVIRLNGSISTLKAMC